MRCKSSSGAAFASFRFNLQRYMDIAATTLYDTASILGTLFYDAYGSSLVRLAENPVRHILDQSWLWVILFLVLIAGGIYLQVVTTTREVEYAPYENRL